MIFVVDDQPDRRRLIRDALQDLGRTILEYDRPENIKGQVEAALATGDAPHVFVVDQRLGDDGNNGISVVGEIADLYEKRNLAAFFILFSRESAEVLAGHVRRLKVAFTVMPISGEDPRTLAKVIKQALGPLPSDTGTNEWAPLDRELSAADRIYVFGRTTNVCHVHGPTEDKMVGQYPVDRRCEHALLNTEIELASLPAKTVGDLKQPTLMFRGRWIPIPDAKAGNVARLLFRWRYLAARHADEWRTADGFASKNLELTAAIGFERGGELRGDIPTTAGGIRNLVSGFWKNEGVRNLAHCVAGMGIQDVLPEPTGPGKWTAREFLAPAGDNGCWRLFFPPEFAEAGAPTFMKRMHFVFDQAEHELHKQWKDKLGDVLRAVVPPSQ